MMSNSRGYEVHVFPEQWQKLQSRSGSNLRRKAAVKLEHYSDVKTSFPRLESSLMALAEQVCGCIVAREFAGCKGESVLRACIALFPSFRESFFH